MDSSDRSEDWLRSVVSALSSDGYSIARNVTFESREFAVVGHYSAFELTKFGNSETFFIFSNIAAITAEDMRGFSAAALKYAIESKAFPLPRGLFETVWCFAVCVTKSMDEDTEKSLRNDAPPRHWSAAEIPVVFNSVTGQIRFYEGTPGWGAAYYQGFRNQIQKYLVFQ